MDILSTSGFSRKYIDQLIGATELKYQSLRAENDNIRSLVERPDVADAVAIYNVDIDAALISDCRTDMLGCGRCAFWNALRKHGINTANAKLTGRERVVMCYYKRMTE